MKEWYREKYSFGVSFLYGKAFLLWLSVKSSCMGDMFPLEILNETDLLTGFIDIIELITFALLYNIILRGGCFLILKLPEKFLHGTGLDRYSYLRSVPMALEISLDICPIAILLLNTVSYLKYYHNELMLADYLRIIAVNIALIIVELILINIRCKITEFSGLYNKIVCKRDFRDVSIMFADGHQIINTWSLLPGNYSNGTVEICSLQILNNKMNVSIEESLLLFNRALVYLSHELRDEELCIVFKKILENPQCNFLIIVKNENLIDSYKDIITELPSQYLPRIVEYDLPIYDHDTMLHILSEYYVYPAMNFVYSQGFVYKGVELSWFKNIRLGPKIVQDMIYIMFRQEAPLRSLYIVFDIIDLMQRLVLAFYAPQTKEWMKKASRNIGNLFHMVTYLEKYGAPLESRIIDMNTCITIPEQYELIKKYMPNYILPESNLTYRDITYLCAMLRNALRGHGSIINSDIPEMFKLLFSLLLADYYILGLDQMKITTMGEKVIGTYCGKERMLSPFLLFIDSKTLIFNNARKGNMDCNKMEYLDYLDGSTFIQEIDWT